MTISTSATCPECEREFDLMDETDADEWHYGHDCEAPDPTEREPFDRPPHLERRSDGWHCLDCGLGLILFDDDEHFCEVTQTSSELHVNDRYEECIGNCHEPILVNEDDPDFQPWCGSMSCARYADAEARADSYGLI